MCQLHDLLSWFDFCCDGMNQTIFYRLGFKKLKFYLQVRHCIQSKIENFDTLALEHGIYDILRSPPDSKHFLTKIVCLFGDSTVANTTRIREAWENELGRTISESMWNRCSSKIHSCSINSINSFNLKSFIGYTILPNCTRFTPLFPQCVTGVICRKVHCLVLSGLALY